MKSCIVSFAPGTGGFFVGATSQCLLHGSAIRINQDGSCHDSAVFFWGLDRLILESSAEGLVHEIAEIKRQLPVLKNKVIVTHARNLHILTERFDKTIYINYVEEDIPAICKKFEHKSDGKQEFNYNNIKDSTWPDFEIFESGNAPAYIYEEMLRRSRMIYQNWLWIIPVLHKTKNLLKINYQSICGHDPEWLYTLSEFLDVPTSSDNFYHALDQWTVYKTHQPA